MNKGPTAFKTCVIFGLVVQHLSPFFRFFLLIKLRFIDRLFLVENLVEMAALGVHTYFKQIFLAVDFAVVLISLVLELCFHLMNSQFAELVGLLVLFRIWRFVRIGHVSLSFMLLLWNSIDIENIRKLVNACYFR